MAGYSAVEVMGVYLAICLISFLGYNLNSFIIVNRVRRVQITNF